MFRSARLKLTVLYTVAIALVMAAFSVALYLAIATATTSNLEVAETASPRVEHALQQAQLRRARLALMGINVVGWIMAASVSYVVAGRTLAPLEAALARQRQFTAHASHELRTPLTVIKGEIDVTRARERSPAEYQESLERIEAEVAHLEGMVGDLLSLARVEAGQAELHRSSGNVATIADEVLSFFQPVVQDREIAVLVNVPSRLEAVLDWSRIRHLLANLVDNALRHTPPGGTIEIRGAPHGRYLDLSVINTGSHIDPVDLPHLFVPFYRGKGSNTVAGTGLGLALCDWIARLHRGSISAHNIPVGVSFDVRLPRY